MTVTTQRTLYGVDLSLASLFGAYYTVLPNTTLNEKFDIEAGHSVPVGLYPTLKYIGLGTGGLSGLNQTEGYINSDHSPLDGALFNQIPFVMRALDNDLTATQRSNYRFRKQIVWGGKSYIAYYLKVIPANAYDSSFYNITTNGTDSIITQRDMSDPSILNPTPKRRVIKIDSLSETTAVTKMAKFRFELSPDEMKELKIVMDIMGGNYQLTEMGLFTGIDVKLSGGVEATCVQASFFLGFNLDLTYTFNKSKSLIKDIELGGSEPLIL